MRTPGSASRTWRTSRAGRTSPAKTTVRTPVVRSRWPTSSPNTEGTALITWPFQVSRSPSTSVFGTNSTVPPVDRVVSSSKTETSKFTEVPASMRQPGGVSRTRTSSRTPLTTLRWVIAAPFGSPVEPEVYITYARLPGASGEVRSVSPGAPPGVSQAVRWSRSTVAMSFGGMVCQVPVSVTANRGAASASTRCARPPRCSGSIGRYAAPDLRIPSSPATRSSVRGSARTTRSSGPTPRRISSHATPFARSSSSR